jgi:sortase A
MRKALRRLSNVLIATGTVLVLDAAVTILWQEPVTAIYATVNQNELAGDLKQLDQVALTASDRRLLRAVRGEQRRIALLARSMDRHLHEGQAIGRIRIPRIGASYVMVEGTGSADLRKGPGHYAQTPLPGMPGTVAVAGHRTTYLAPFSKLDQLHAGDRIELDMPYATVTYRVERTRVVLPTALWVTRRVAYNRLVLSACTPRFSASHRIVVFARQLAASARSR